MIISETKSVTLSGSETVEDFVKFFEGAPPHAVIRIATHKADRNMSDYHTLTASWNNRTPPALKDSM